MRTPTVVHVLQPRVGGVPRYVLDLARELTGRGWDITVVGPPDAGLRSAFEARGADYAAFDLDPGRMPSPRADGRAVASIVRVCRARGPDVLHAHSTKAGIVAGIAGKIAEVPSIYTPHAWAFQMGGHSRWQRDVLRLGEGILSRAVHREVIAICTAERDAAVLARVVNGKRTFVARTGFQAPNGPVPTRAQARHALGLTQNGTVVAWIGREGPQKQPGHVARLAAALGESARVLVLGSGVADSPDGLAIVAAGGRVLPEGTDPTLLRAAADVYVQTSAWEGLPLTILEAAGAGLPVVSYDVGGVREQVRNGVTGYLVPPNELEALVDAVRRLVGDAAVRRTMGEAGRSHVTASFPVTGMVAGIEARYRAVAADVGPHPALAR